MGGTRCLTRVFCQWQDKDAFPVVAIYSHLDGYPSEQGKLIAEFLDGLEVINGIPGNPPARYANGGGDLAAQLVVAMRKEINCQLVSPIIQECGQEYEYHITIKETLKPRRSREPTSPT